MDRETKRLEKEIAVWKALAEQLARTVARLEDELAVRKLPKEYLTFPVVENPTLDAGVIKPSSRPRWDVCNGKVK